VSFHNFPAGTQAIIGAITPLVTDIEVESIVASGICRAGIRFGASNPEGANALNSRKSVNVYALLGIDDNAVDHTGEFTAKSIDPTEWEVALLSYVVGTFDIEFAAAGVYTTLDTLLIDYSETRSGGKGYTPGTNTCTANFRIREVADTANFTDFQVFCTATQT
jgi:hypothetical protein